MQEKYKKVTKTSGASFVAIIVLLLVSACSSFHKIPYFQDLPITSTEKIENFYPLTIEFQDVLGINVNSLNSEASAIFSKASGSNQNGSPTDLAQGYLVDEKGEIHLPLLGTIKVAGLTISQAREQLQKRLTTYLKDPVVNIRVINFKVSVLGDVLRPDVYNIANGRLTIPEALSLAGDLNITAVRDNVLLIREQEGKRMYVHIDLTSKGIFTSPYYYLKTNDIIYVQPDKTKYATVDRGYRTTSLILSGLSVIAIVLSTVYR